MDKTLSRISALAKSVVKKDEPVILFGSRARGEGKATSDWDILIILNRPVLHQKDYDEVSYPFVTLGYELNQEINPILYTAQEWAKYRQTPFYNNVLRDGKRLN
ncbi:MAG: nucleotidyltransferase domain-containing protein [Bacteroidales bacterium]|nr:nucleotidyltransferase domain-containing protein [Bacteroidales bacterium]